MFVFYKKVWIWGLPPPPSGEKTPFLFFFWRLPLVTLIWESLSPKSISYLSPSIDPYLTPTFLTTLALALILFQWRRHCMWINYIYDFSVHVLRFSNKYKLVPWAADGSKMYDISFKLLAYYFEKRRLWDPDQWSAECILCCVCLVCVYVIEWYCVVVVAVAVCIFVWMNISSV